MAQGCCSVDDCTADRGTKFYCFPDPDGCYKDLFKIWVRNCRNPRLQNICPKQIKRGRKVCNLHFEKELFAASGRLLKHAIPTLKLSTRYYYDGDELKPTSCKRANGASVVTIKNENNAILTGTIVSEREGFKRPHLLITMHNGTNVENTLQSDALSEENDKVTEEPIITERSVTPANLTVEPLIESYLQEDIIQTEAPITKSPPNSAILTTSRLIGNLETNGNICLICKYTKNNTKWFDISHTYTKRTNTRIIQVLGTISDNLFAGYNKICEKCFELLNELDYTHKRYIDIKKKVLNYINQSKMDLNGNLLPNADRKEGIVNENVEVNENITPRATRKQFKCDLCEKTFITSSKLKAHANSHTDKLKKALNRPIEVKCHICNVTVMRNYLIEHLRTHMDYKKHVCSVCGKKFTEKHHMLVHQRLHDNFSYKSTHKCDYCSETFVDSIKLNEHLLREHKNMNCLPKVF